MIQYPAIVERAKHNDSAYVSDLPGCVTIGTAREETLQNMREAIAMHLAGLREDSEPVPRPRALPSMSLFDVRTPAGSPGSRRMSDGQQ